MERRGGERGEGRGTVEEGTVIKVLPLAVVKCQKIEQLQILIFN